MQLQPENSPDVQATYTNSFVRRTVSVEGSGGKVAIPQLRITLTYDRPTGSEFAVDAFPEQQHNPVTDHAMFMNLMPTAVMVQAVNCINTDRTC